MIEEIARKPSIQLFWNKKNVTNKIEQYASKITYMDHEEEASDEVELVLDNTTGIWFEEWYPTAGDTLQLRFGYPDKMIDSGLYQVDEITLTGVPDQITIKALAAGITDALRTRNNKAFEEQTLRQIANYFCVKHGFTLVDGSNMLSQIWLDRKTQEMKTDMAFLSELAKEYGFLFSIKGKKMVFISYYDLENTDSVAEVYKTKLKDYSITEKTYDTYASAEIRQRNPKKGKLVTSNNTYDGWGTTVKEKLIVSGHASTANQAEAKVKGGLWGKNKYKQSGTITIPGEPSLIAGQNLDLTGFGMGSGKYHVVTSTHTIDQSGYTTSMEIRKTGTIPKPKRIPRTSKPKPTLTEQAQEDTGEWSEY
ncbi:MAG: hypothetical protein Q8909_16835 [Bacteroidota bacterium]|nr:hypothetical protein [Bacteroidota bacterium]